VTANKNISDVIIGVNIKSLEVFKIMYGLILVLFIAFMLL
jgi:hypothetical protein